MASDDDRHLDILAVLHYVLAAMATFFGLFPIAHLVIGVLILTGRFDDTQDGPPQVVGIVFIAAALVAMTFAWSLAVVIFLAARRLSQRISYKFCFIVAAVQCAFVPLGTALGVATLLVLTRPSVKAMFGQRSS